jgi:DAK2 domain fusion protein YloV
MKTINGLMLKKMIISGANNLYNHYPEVDALNVFPVPDGDTGMNMNLTMSSGAKEVANRNDEGIYDIAKAFSKGLLMGARGNSGVITSQIFRGFAQGLEGKTEINAVQFAEAWLVGKEIAYKAVMRPVEGTMLTVIREAATTLNDRVEDQWTIDQAMDVLLNEARESLKRTPELLPILKEVGVVDSGGLGLIKIMEGFISAMHGIVIEKEAATATQDRHVGHEMAGAKLEAEEFGYCTEFVLKIGEGDGKKVFDQERFTTFLNEAGNSLVVVRDDDLVKVHVHTLNPGGVFTYAQKFGEFLSLKSENMSLQHENLSKDHVGKNVEHAHKPLNQEKVTYGKVAVASGEGLAKTFKELGIDVIISGGQTKNPSTEDFIKAIREANAKVVYLLPNNPNIMLAAKQAADNLDLEGVKAYVIPSKTIPQGLVACLNFNPEATAEENLQSMSASLNTVKSGAVTFSIKDTVIKGLKLTKNHFMGIFEKEIVCSDPDLYKACENLLQQMLDDASSIVTILLGENAVEKKLQAVLDKFKKKFPSVEFDVKQGNQEVYSFLIGVE